jgi:F-type H+-transporting ATPase subunit epsilon
MAELHVSILTPAKVVGKFKATQVQVPGSEGFLGILPGHALLVAEVGVGELTVYSGGASESFFVSGGYVDVANDNVTLLADVAEKPGDIDVEHARQMRQQALDHLDQKIGVDVIRAQAALFHAEQRLSIAARHVK